MEKAPRLMKINKEDFEVYDKHLDRDNSYKSLGDGRWYNNEMYQEAILQLDSKATATFKLPKMETKTVWYGCLRNTYGSYGGQYDCILFFKTRPKVDPNEGVLPWKESKNGNVCGSMWPDEFESLTGMKVAPQDIKVAKLYKLELTAPWDENGNLVQFSTNADGWVN